MKMGIAQALITVMLAMQAAYSFAQTPLGSEFTYQGRLQAAGMPPISTADFQASLYDADAGGNQIGATILKENTAVVEGLFSISLDFGVTSFNGDARWLQVAVQSPAGSGGFTTLTPRQPIAATPYSAQTRGLFVDTFRRVGIGTTGPTAFLDVKGVGSTGLSFGTPIARFTRGDGNNYLAIFSDIGGNYIVSDDPGTNQKDLRLQTRNSRNILLEPDGFGRVGIGTSVPASAMHLSNFNPVLVLQDNDSFGAGSGHIDFWNSEGETASMGFKTPNSFDLSISNLLPTGNINIIPSSGNVGIGTSDPQSKLHVDGDTQVAGTLQIKRGSGDRAVFRDSQNRTHFRITDQLDEDYPTFRMISPITGDIQAGMFRSVIDDAGVLHADEKNFRAPNPADASTDIWYCCPEGPEAAMYVRGTGRLVNGRATIELPDHFRNLAHEPGMTVQLTPRSLESKGLATSKVSLSGIEVGELQSGTGDYEFDWRVEAVRKGHENFQVIRPWLRSDDDPDKAWQNRLKHIEERRAHGKPSPDTNAATSRPQD